MASVNKVILVGNLGRDPEIRYSSSGQPVTNFSIATTEYRTNKEGEKTEQTEWHRIVAFGRLAEICSEYLSKGKSVYIEGSIRTNQWNDKEGNKRYTTEIIARQMQMLGPKTGQYDSDTSHAEPPQAEDPFGPDDDVPF